VNIEKIPLLIAEDKPETGKEYGRKGGLIGGPKRAAKLSKKRGSEIARWAAKTRWAKTAVSLSTHPD
jgi:hypothetical protein